VIKINLVREGKAAVRGGGQAASAGPAASSGPSNINNMLIIGLLLLGIVLAGGYWLVKNRQLASKQEQVALRKAEADKLQHIIQEVARYQTQKDSLQKRIDLINQLKQNQKGPVRILDRISQDLPDLVWLDKMTESSGEITLSGRGLNPNAVANFVENVKSDPIFEEPQLSSLVQISTAPIVYTFDMTFHFTYAPKKTPGMAAATSTAPGAPATSSSGVPGGRAKG
jgi:Tfp pilus assembly protein PilN